MILFINSLVLLIIIILFILPANKKSYLSNFALAGAFSLFIASLVFLSIPMASSIYVISGSFNLITFPSFVINYSYMLDNISVFYILLSTFLGCVTVLLTRNIHYRLKENYILLFVIQWLLINCFLTQEILLFYLFFEALLIPVYAIIGIWGSQRDKIFAANQFFLYTLFGSFIMLIGIVLVIIINGTTNIIIIKGYTFDSSIENILFILFFFSFCIKIPMLPMHLWLPKAHVEAPTHGSVLLAGILLKLGSYGFLRYSIFLFPQASLFFLPLILSLCVLSILLASITVIRQSDLKRIIAYSSIAHMNFLVAGLFVKDLLALSGSILLQFAHGLSSTALFLVVGFLYDRMKTRNIYYIKGLVTTMPFLSFYLVVFSLANLGIPGSLNFIAEILIFIGLFQKVSSIAILTLFGILLCGIYSFTMLTRIVFGPSAYFLNFYDLTRREFYILAPLLFLIILLGLAPNFVVSFWSFSISTWFIN
jgi:NADH-quinone oxidoreductase subunit M